MRAQLLGLCSSLEFVAVFSSIFCASPCLTYPKEPVYHLGHTYNDYDWKKLISSYKSLRMQELPKYLNHHHLLLSGQKKGQSEACYGLFPSDESLTLPQMTRLAARGLTLQTLRMIYPKGGDEDEDEAAAIV